MICVALFLASPYWMLYQIHQGIEQNNPEKISRYINFTSVRESLKPQIKNQIDQQLGLDNKHKKIELFGINLTEKIADKTVDFAVTPQTVNLLLQGKQLKESVDLPDLNSVTQIFQQQTSVNFEEESQPKISESSKEKGLFDNARYLSWNKFEVTVAGKAPEITPQNRFIFKREGLSWKMKEIYLK